MASYDLTTKKQNTVVMPWLHMCAMAFFKPVATPTDPEAMPPSPNQVLDTFKVVFLNNAYVILLPLENVGPFDAHSCVIGARTDGEGGLMQITDAEIDGPVPTDKTKRVSYSPRAKYAYFWTLEKKQFKEVWKEVLADQNQALTEHPFSAFHAVEGSISNEGFPELKLTDENRAKLNLLTGQGGLSAVLPSYPLVRSWDLRSKFGLTDAKLGTNYVIARNEALASLWVADLVYHEASRRRLERAKHWVTIQGMEDIASQAVGNVRLPALEEELMTLPSNVGPVKASVETKAFAEYAYLCAKGRIDRKIFRKSITIGNDDWNWREIAIGIERQLNIRHPGRDANGHLKDFDIRVPPMMRYFDYYNFGFSRAQIGDDGAVKHTRDRIDAEMERVASHVRDLLKTRVPIMRFIQDLNAHALPDKALRDATEKRYLDLSEMAAHEWWSTLELEKDAWFKRFELYAEWTAIAAEKLGHLFEERFGEPEHIARYNQIVKDGIKGFERMFDKIYEFHKRYPGKTDKRAIGGGMRVVPDFNSGLFTIVDKQGHTQHAIQVRFLERARGTTQIKNQVKFTSPRYKTSPVVTKTVQQTPGVYVYDAPFKKIPPDWPVWMKAIGDGIALYYMLKEGAENLENHHHIDVLGTVRDVFKMTGSASTVYYYSVSKGMPMTRVLQALGHVGKAGYILEGALNFQEGAMLLWETQLPSHATAEEVVPFGYKIVKGLVLVGTVVPAAYAFGFAALSGATLAAAYMAAMGPLGWGLSVGALLLLALDIVYESWKFSEDNDTMDPFIKELEEAVEKEYGSKMIVPNESKTLKGLREFVPVARGLLTVL
jgi:hypothetical protein